MAFPHRLIDTIGSREGSERGLHALLGLAGRLRELLAATAEPRIRLRTLAFTRWIAVAGQAFTIAFVHLSLGFELPLPPLIGAVALSALINVALSLRASARARLSERNTALLLGYDVLQLGFMLALTGGLQNPFAVLLIVPVTISATILSLGTTTILCLVVIGTTTLLGLYPTDLPWRDDGLQLPALYLLAMWVALVLASLLMAVYGWRVADEARRMADALAATQMALERERRLSALGGLAAAAAHELGSPLATIAVTAREIANSVQKDSPLAEDIAELVTQSQRCREILRALTRAPDPKEHAPFTRMSLSQLVESVAEAYAQPEVAVAVEVLLEPPGTPEPMVGAEPELRHGLANLIDNAIRFAASEVHLAIEVTPAEIVLVIEDDGPGFPDAVLDNLGEPYLSTRRASGGLGLGVFIAQTLLARTGASLQFENARPGARVRVKWVRDRLPGGVLEGVSP